MRQPRPPESFPRVYSPPEPPSTARRSALVGVLTVLLAFGLAGLAVFFLGSGFGGKPAPSRSLGAAPPQPSPVDSPVASGAPSPTVTASPTPADESPSSSSSSSLPEGQLYVRLPPVCGTPSQAMSVKLVPTPRITAKSGNTTTTLCTVTSKEGSHPTLHVETRLFTPQEDGDAIKDATGQWSADWTQAHAEGLSRTVVLQRRPGLGDEAFHWYRIDKGQPVVVGEVEVRVRNVVVRVAYSRDAPAGSDGKATRERLLDEAAQVALHTVRALV